MSANSVLNKRTAMPEDSKIRSLTNELVRRLLRTRESMGDGIKTRIIDDFAQKLLNSGYSIFQTRNIIVAGLKGYEKLLRKSRMPGGWKLHRTSSKRYQSRTRKKLTEKSEWFRQNKKDDVDIELDDVNDDKYMPKGWSKSAELNQKTRQNKASSQKEDTLRVRSVLFVEASKGGVLAKSV